LAMRDNAGTCTLASDMPMESVMLEIITGVAPGAKVVLVRFHWLRSIILLLGSLAALGSVMSGKASAKPMPNNPVVSATGFANLSSAVAANAGSSATLLISTQMKVNDLTTPAGLTLKLVSNGSIAVAQGKTVYLGGPLEAERRKIFNGPGRVRFAPSSTAMVYPEWWGAGDGLQSAAAIQSAIDSLEKGEVRLSSSTYILDRRRRIRFTGSVAGVDAILSPKSRVSIVGEGNESILKVADNFTASGDYVVIAPLHGEPISDVSLKNFSIDGNGFYNLVKGSTGGLVRRAMAIWLFSGRNIRIDGVNFINQPGRNVVKFGNDSMAYLVTDSTIENCTFTNMGGAIPGNRNQNDHSTVYVSGRNVTLRNNRLSNPEPHDANRSPAVVVAGLEIHGYDMTVSNNRVENYSTGGYIVADGFVAAANQRWTGNEFINMTKMGISLWSVQKVKKIVIEGNTIRLNGELDQCVAGIFQSFFPPDTTMGFDDLKISGNMISGGKARRGTVWNGISLTAVTNTVISGNAIDNVSGGGIVIYGNKHRPLDCTNIVIEGNTVRDTGFNRYGAYPYAIDISNDGKGRFADIRVTGNSIQSSGFSPAMRGIRVGGGGQVSGVRVDGTNRFSGIAAEHRISGTVSE